MLIKSMCIIWYKQKGAIKMDKIFMNIICDVVEAGRKFYQGLGYEIVEEYSS